MQTRIILNSSLAALGRERVLSITLSQYKVLFLDDKVYYSKIFREQTAFNMTYLSTSALEYRKYTLSLICDVSVNGN